MAMQWRLACVIPLLLTSGCQFGPTKPPTAIVLITLDTTRVDRLTPYGFASASMPSLDRLAAESVVFDQAVSVAPLTFPAHASILTGLLPPSHGVRDNNSPRLHSMHTTLAESLQARGFRTAAFVGASVLARDRGLEQGFDHYGEGVVGHATEPPSHERSAGAVVTEALQWLEGMGDDQPFFLWVHLYDAHAPYAPPEPFASRYSHDPYVGELAYVDSEVGRLLATIDRRFHARSLVIVAGDHGESLGEHGEQRHGIFVYENVMRVPLMVRTPGIQPRRVDSLVSVTDIAPTAMTLTGAPWTNVDGKDRVSLMQGAASEGEAYFESFYPMQLGWSPLRAIRDARFKLIDAPKPELYDLAHDPYEVNNLYQERTALAAAMRDRLDELVRGREQRIAPQDEPQTDRDVAERLAALGYVARARYAGTPPPNAPDPKDCIQFIEAPNRALPTVHKRPAGGC
jgi:arylsulfatase A-like enzyme